MVLASTMQGPLRQSALRAAFTPVRHNVQGGVQRRAATSGANNDFDKSALPRIMPFLPDADFQSKQNTTIGGSGDDFAGIVSGDTECSDSMDTNWMATVLGGIVLI
jgi:hypothetical protein